MKQLLLPLFLLIFLPSCTIKTPKNEWQLKSTKAFNSYTKNFYHNNDALAKNDLSRALKHAKQSANLTQLAKIYLGECALNISAGVNDNCQRYKELSTLVKDKELDAYYSFLSFSLTKEQIKNLPPQYKNFASTLLTKEYEQANRELLQIDNLSSKLLCASLIKENLEAKTRKEIIQQASYNGYKKIVLFWLEQSKLQTMDQEEKNIINKKILILNSSE